ncbi:putative glycoside hydrolase [Nocardia asiatica]|uniref:putative glycoside hydrolase n=1 Tax=Nocardia asiatica TaxID=209252 RepID=UPI0024547FF9|nr:putative glycoside hydrolase [Nocardia asiatica]
MLIANRCEIVILGKWLGRTKWGNTEAGSADAFDRIKADNPTTQVFYSWSACDYFTSFYESMQDGKLPELYALKVPDGNEYGYLNSWHSDALFWDTSNREMREWWVECISDEVRRIGYDGVYVDGIKQYVMRLEEMRTIAGHELADQLATGVSKMMSALRAELRPYGTKVIYNGIKHSPLWPDGGARFVYDDLADGVLLESFGRNAPPSPEPSAMVADMSLAASLDASERIVAFTAGRDTAPNNPKVLEFAIGCFLACAGDNSFFRFVEDRDDLHSSELYGRSLGPPKGPAEKKEASLAYSREFEYATVDVDIDTRKARIVWKARGGGRESCHG